MGSATRALDLTTGEWDPDVPEDNHQILMDLKFEGEQRLPPAEEKQHTQR